ncbi:aldo/keto reductase [Paraburkholderia nemoris]|uniref:Pyridoxine 4-dehydrogenase n=1 Tax=Paraburkholderia nemoris TaxID=2793076 RepID=A0ABM8QYC7_9BURK|nr:MULTISPECIES: aldo/keto reductase [Paraburkholderia]MBK3810055.1 aldo/keto reductase [Paraburkholderia aspalathi]CAE6722694.1 Pyridoxine 4-dehydrogenase [Paraburkholderia nemoris]CAE6750434.1 Pyridoxine 4-dehydrogenase [Paraburkholderia nemoris]
MNAATSVTTDFLLGGDLPINRLGFGAMRLATNGFRGPARDPETGRSVLRRALELSINLVDTADYYQSTDGTVRANALIREALHPYPTGIVIATKVGHLVNADGSFTTATPADMRRLVEGNLQSLGLERLDLVYLRIGEMAPPHGESLAERFEALAVLREEGLIRHLGISNVDKDHLAEARSIASVAAVQNSFHIKERGDLTLLEECASAGIAFSPFSPMGGGTVELEDVRLTRVAARRDATSSQIALAWLLAYSPVMLAIPGTGSVKHLEENAKAASIHLTEEDLAELA